MLTYYQTNMNQARMKSQETPFIEVFQYGMLAFALAFVSLPVYIHAPEFYATHYKISVGTIGSSILFLRLIDAFQDPLIGFLCDRFNKYRFNILLFGVLLLPLSVLMLFNEPQFNSLLWFIVATFLATTAYSIISINYYSIGAVLSFDKKERTRITSTREAIGLIGLLVASILPAVLRNIYPDEIALSYFSYVFCMISVILGFYFLKWLKGNLFLLKNNVKSGRVKVMKFSMMIESLMSNWRFFLVFSISTFASAIPAVLVLFFINDRMHLNKYSGFFLFCYFIAGAVVMPLWNKFANRYGKVKGWMLSMAIAIISFVWAFSLESGDFIPFFLISICSGIAFGAELAIPPSLLADLTDQNKELRNTSFALLTFSLKFMLALASGITLYLLGKVSYQPGAKNSEETLFWLSFYYGLIPCIIKFIAMLLLKRIGVRYEKIAK